MAEHEPVPLSEVDLSDLDRFRDDLAWGQFDTLRREDPVHWNEEPAPNRGFWSVTRYEDIWAVDKDTETFTSEKFVNLEEVDDDLMDIRRSILETDGQRHLALRAAHRARVQPAQPDEELRGLPARADQADGRRRRCGARSSTSSRRSARDFPIQVLARLLDVPLEDTGQLIAWGNEMVGQHRPRLHRASRSTRPESEKYKHLPFRSPTTQDVFDYGRALRDRRKGGDGTDLVSMLANKIPMDGVPLSDRDFDNYFLLLVIAGNETTRQAISNSMLGLIEQREQLQRAAGGPVADRVGPRGAAALGLARSTTSVVRRPATSRCTTRRSRRATRSSCGSPPATGTSPSSRTPTRIDVTPPQRRPPDLRQGQPAPVPRQRPGPDGGPADVRGAAAAARRHRARGDVTRVRSNFVNGIKKFPVAVSSADLDLSRRARLRPEPGPFAAVRGCASRPDHISFGSERLSRRCCP